MSTVIELADDETFEALVLDERTRPVLVDFSAAWCGPCQSLAKTLEALAPEFAAGLKLVKIDVDEAPETAAAFGARALPYLIVFENGLPTDRLIGNPGPARLKEFLTKNRPENGRNHWVL